MGVVILLLAVFFIKVGFTKSDEKDHGDSKKKVQKKVDAFVVTPSLLTSDITVTGSLVAFDEVELMNEVAGRVVGVNLPEGKSVAKGTLLVKLFDDDLQAALKKLEAQRAIQQRIVNRQKQLLQVKGISENDYEQSTLQLNIINADIAQQRALIRKTEIRAPFNGTIGLRNVSVGAVVSSSTMLATIRTNDKIKLDFYVPEKYGSVITVGMPVNFTMYDNNTSFTAKVIATEHGIENSTRNLKVRAMVSSSSKELIPGAFANVNLKLGENKNALMIPTEAIIPDEDNKQLIVANHGKAHFVDIKTGIRQSSKIEVIEGIASGDTIITTGLLFLKEGAKLSYSSINK